MIVGICGSPRDQATEYVLKEALRMLDEKGFETKFWTVKGNSIDFCAHCDYCLQKQRMRCPRRYARTLRFAF